MLKNSRRIFFAVLFAAFAVDAFAINAKLEVKKSYNDFMYGRISDSIENKLGGSMNGIDGYVGIVVEKEEPRRTKLLVLITDCPNANCGSSRTIYYLPCDGRNEGAVVRYGSKYAKCNGREWSPTDLSKELGSCPPDLGGETIDNNGRGIGNDIPKLHGNNSYFNREDQINFVNIKCFSSAEEKICSDYKEKGGKVKWENGACICTEVGKEWSASKKECISILVSCSSGYYIANKYDIGKGCVECPAGFRCPDKDDPIKGEKAFTYIACAGNIEYQDRSRQTTCKEPDPGYKPVDEEVNFDGKQIVVHKRTEGVTYYIVLDYGEHAGWMTEAPCTFGKTCNVVPEPPRGFQIKGIKFDRVEPGSPV